MRRIHVRTSCAIILWAVLTAGAASAEGPATGCILAASPELSPLDRGFAGLYNLDLTGAVTFPGIPFSPAKSPACKLQERVVDRFCGRLYRGLQALIPAV